MNTYGRSITASVYLNTKLKPIDHGDGIKKHPLYVRVSAKRQLTSFRYRGADDQFVTKSHWDKTLSKIPKNEWIIINDIEHLLHLVDIHERDNVTIQNIPKLLDGYYALGVDVRKVLILRMQQELDTQGYKDLSDIIDWTKPMAGIITKLKKFEQSFKLPRISLPYTRVQFSGVFDLLETVKMHNGLKGNIENLTDSIMEGIPLEKINGITSETREVIVKAIHFYRFAYKQTTALKITI